MSLNEEERRIIVNLELEKATNTMTQIPDNCSYDATQQEIEPMIEPAKRLIDKVSSYIFNNSKTNINN